MKEVKKILKALEDTCCCPYHDKMCLKAKNYIINIQKENEKYKIINEVQYKVIQNSKEYITGYVSLQSIINKAIEYIEKELCFRDINTFEKLYTKSGKDLLDILKGEGEEYDKN